MTNVFILDELAIWRGEIADIDLDQGRPPNAIPVQPPAFDHATHFAAWSGEDWLVQPIGDMPKPLEPLVLVPAAVTMRQARIALSRAWLLSKAEAAIAQMAGQAGEEARIEWEYAAELKRDHPLIAALGQALGLSAEAIDDLFREAATI
ncbi:hypothetical protein [Aureimonas sp. D3]|uniref:hypothetical protein n=1 Tax=Aureimonas sp. D3 TaxID=1638164 RepID=UPI000782EC9A|nr:hypothetical protein [Aureimonas sp. D3]